MAASLNTPAVLSALRDRLATIPSLARVYSASEVGANGLPSNLSELPCATIIRGPSVGYRITQPMHTYTYEVLVQLYEAGGFVGQRAASVLPLPEAVLGKLLSSVTLGGLVTYVIYKRDGGLLRLEYGGQEYTGYELVLEVQQAAAISAAPGSAP